MLECNFTSEDIFVCGNVFCYFEISSQYAYKPKFINEYNQSFIRYEFKNHIKYAKIQGNLYIYNGCIKATDKVTSFCYVDDLIVKDGFVHEGDLLLQGDFFVKGIYAKESVYACYNMPVNIIRRVKLKQLFYG